MHELPCRKHAGGAEGFVIAWNARNGKEYWRVRAARSSRRRWSSARTSTSARGTTASTPTGSAASGGRCCAGRSGRRPDRRGARPCRPDAVRRDEQRSVYGVDARPGARSGTPHRSRASVGASTSTRRRRSPTGASSSETRTAPSTRSAPARSPALGARGRDVRLHGGRGLAENGLRRHLGRDFIALDARTGEPRWRFAAPSGSPARRQCRARLLLHVRAVRRGRAAAGGRSVPGGPSR